MYYQYSELLTAVLHICINYSTQLRFMLYTRSRVCAQRGQNAIVRQAKLGPKEWKRSLAGENPVRSKPSQQTGSECYVVQG
jgi:hypothetical protein